MGQCMRDEKFCSLCPQVPMLLPTHPHACIFEHIGHDIAHNRLVEPLHRKLSNKAISGPPQERPKNAAALMAVGASASSSVCLLYL